MISVVFVGCFMLFLMSLQDIMANLKKKTQSRKSFVVIFRWSLYCYHSVLIFRIEVISEGKVDVVVAEIPP